MNILSSRTPRERWLIIIAASLVMIFLIWQFGARPILTNKSVAKQNQQAALRDLDIVKRGLPRLTSAPAGTRAPFNRSSVIAAARNANVTISRVQPAPEEALQVWFEDTDAPILFKLLSDISSRFDVNLERVQITRRESGRVSAQITLAPL